MSGSPWIDFKKLRQSLLFKEVLDHYKVELKAKGKEQHSAYCPLPTHQGHGSGRTLSVNLKRGLWKCWGCGDGGNALDFAVRMEGLNPGHPTDVRKVALMLAELFGKAEAMQTSNDARSAPSHQNQSSRPKQRGDRRDDHDMPRVVNAPLDFELKGLDPTHPSLKALGLNDETIRHFGLGYCSRGMLAGRIAIPLHDATGKLIGYAGRLADPSAATSGNPKYRFPEDRERHGTKYLFRKQLLVYNLYHLKVPTNELIIVPGFTALWRLWQAGQQNAVSLMNYDCSGEQAGLIAATATKGKHLEILIPDTQLGKKCASSVFARIGARLFIRARVATSMNQPDHIASS